MQWLWNHTHVKVEYWEETVVYMWNLQPIVSNTQPLFKPKECNNQLIGENKTILQKLGCASNFIEHECNLDIRVSICELTVVIDIQQSQ